MVVATFQVRETRHRPVSKDLAQASSYISYNRQLSRRKVFHFEPFLRLGTHQHNISSLDI